jgi:hypothetical protein
MRNLFLAALLAVSASALRADFTYTQTSQMTGGALVNMMRNLGPLAGKAREPNVTVHILKGNKMASVTRDSTTIIDIDAETITAIDNAKKTYSVTTFAQMKQASEQALARAQGRNKSGAELNYKVSAKATGQSKTVSGFNAKQVVTTMEAEVKDQSQQSGAVMNIVLDNWLATVPGYEEVRVFQRRMGAKMGYLFGSGMSQIGAMQPQTMKGFAQVAEEMAKVDGVPVEQVIRMGGSGDAAPAPDGTPARQQAPQAQSRSDQQTASAAAAAAALSRLGFGRNRNKGQESPQQDPPAGGGAASSSDSLIEMTTQLTSFSSGPADTSKFEIPAGFKQVENPMLKSLK